MKYLPSLTGTLSGSMGGCTASHNRAGQYFRNRVVPTNPNTTRQQNVRSYFASAVNVWATTLTDAQRAAWTDWANNVPFTDTLGQAFNLTGQQAFIRTNVPRFQIGMTAIAAAPTDFNNGQPVAGINPSNAAGPGLFGIITATAVFSTDANLMSGAPADGDLLLQIGPPVSAGTNFYKGSYQLAAVIAVTTAQTQIAINTAVAAQLQATSLVVGERRPIRARILYDDGRLSDPYEIIAPVVDDT